VGHRPVGLQRRVDSWEWEGLPPDAFIQLPPDAFISFIGTDIEVAPDATIKEFDLCPPRNISAIADGQPPYQGAAGVALIDVAKPVQFTANSRSVVGNAQNIPFCTASRQHRTTAELAQNGGYLKSVWKEPWS
jgi:hypothetical protein